jgi:hypothetical protein
MILTIVKNVAGNVVGVYTSEAVEEFDTILEDSPQTEELDNQDTPYTLVE